MSNVFTCVGTVTRDAEVRFLPSGQAVLNVSIANNQGFGDKQKTIFIRCALFGKRAEGQLKDYLLKGTQILVSGELSQTEYQANDGTTKTSLELNATVLDLIGKRSDSAPQSAPAQAAQKPVDNMADDVPYDDDIPF